MSRLSRNTPSLLDGVDDTVETVPSTNESPRVDDKEEESPGQTVETHAAELPAAVSSPGDDRSSVPDLDKPTRKRAPALDTDAGRRERRRFAEDLASESIKGAIKVLKLAASGGTNKRGVKITPLQVDAAKQLIELSAGKTPSAELDKGLKRVLIADQPKPGTPDAKMLRCTCINCLNLREKSV